jgi:hypothetical protein
MTSSRRRRDGRTGRRGLELGSASREACITAVRKNYIRVSSDFSIPKLL